jgi:hypothetical protein
MGRWGGMAGGGGVITLVIFWAWRSAKFFLVIFRIMRGLFTLGAHTLESPISWNLLTLM